MMQPLLALLLLLSVQEGTTLKEHVEYLASEKLEGRGTGTEGALKAADYVGRSFLRAGLETRFQSFQLKKDFHCRLQQVCF